MKFVPLCCAMVVCCMASAKHLTDKQINCQYLPNASVQVTLTGQVYCNSSLKPIVSVISLAIDGTTPIRLSADATGKFSAQVPAVKSIKIQALAEGYEPSEVEYLVPNTDTTVFVEIYLTPKLPTFKLVLEGTILDAKTQQPISAELDLFYNSDIVKEDVQIIHDGKFQETASKPGWYIIDILSPGYISITDTVWVVHEGNRTVRKDYRLTPIEVGLNVVIDNLYFYFGQTSLKPESFGSLNRVNEFIKANPTLVLEIAGHTDDEGADDYNLTLSQGRAEAVVQYLIKEGIEPTRLIAHGYGEAKPIDMAKTKAAKAKNRRVEFTIVKK